MTSPGAKKVLTPHDTEATRDSRDDYNTEQHDRSDRNNSVNPRRNEPSYYSPYAAQQHGTDSGVHSYEEGSAPRIEDDSYNAQP